MYYTMGSKNLDFEIVYSVQKGNNSFSDIWYSIPKGNGSKITFSKRLPQLVKSKVLIKKIMKKKTQYFVNRDLNFTEIKESFIKAENEIQNIKKKGKTLSEKKLLETFVRDTIANMILIASFRFDMLMPHYETHGNLNEQRIQMLEKLVKTRIDILTKRSKSDEELLISFYDLVDDNLMNTVREVYK
jgi:hypothetical protein